jgi:hypothetical protein
MAAILVLIVLNLNVYNMIGGYPPSAFCRWGWEMDVSDTTTYIFQNTPPKIWKIENFVLNLYHGKNMYYL